ncbi:hypothetical protein ANCDUO_07084 [Ancylostoma duodenale]|uniref:Major facilitator superfamily (MFS) profile domain-containing protein n=1 Tax=Ancylostoma duodenale TaxID=51022 RepID=A0A0C2DJE6_9BILA|nr:hypothetical protein ANCDUO_07084 [Ancylostoma duodenale]
MQDVVAAQTTNGTENTTEHAISGHWLNDPARKNVLFSVVAVGQLIGTLPIVPVMHKIGLRNTFTFYGLVAQLATILLPWAVELGHIYVVVTRIVQLSAVLTMPLASAFCESALGWRYLYYSFGAVGLLLSAAFFFFYTNHPRKHSLVSPKELSAITHGKEEQTVKEPAPYKEICKDRCMQAVLLTTFGGNTAFFIFMHFGPTFMNLALGLDITETGYATALPYAMCLALKFVAGPLFDIATFIPEKYRMIMFASISQGTNNKLIAQVAYSGAVAFNGLNIVGSIKCAQVTYPQP